MIPDEHQALITAMASTFADEKLRPHAVRWDREGNLDRSALREMAGLGLGGIYTSEPYGGSGLSRLDAALIFEHLSQGCISHAAFLSIHNMATWMMDAFGDDALRKKFVPKLTAGDMFASYCLTGPDARSDAASLRTSGRREGDSYVLNGSKAFVSGAGFSDLYLVMARTGEGGARAISAFVVEAGTPGLSFGVPERKMG